MRRKSENRSLTSAVAATLVGLAFLSCSPSSPSDPGRTQGQIQVNVSTSGTGVPSSFTVTLNGGSSRAVEPDGSVTFGSLNPGNYTVALGVPGNCTISDAAEQSVGVQEGSTSTVAFSVSCSAVPTGAIGVTTGTTGSPADPDGYAVSVDEGAATPIGVNDNLLIPDLVLGDHEVELSGVADNCLVQGANPRTVSVTENQTTPTEFEVVCSATSGRIDVSVTTTGGGLDPDGYDVDLDGGAVTRPVDTNGSAEFTGVEQGEHTLTLSGVASNCTVTSDHPVSVEVVAGETVDANFTVECEATTGSIRVTVTTTGDAIDDDGYSVVLNAGASTELVDPNDTIVFSGLVPNEYTLDLQNVAGNCTVTSDDPATAEVTAGAQTDVAFTVECEDLTGDIQVNMSTTGDNEDPNGYTVSLDGGAGLSVSNNGSRTFADVVIGDYEIEIDGVASNCAVQGSNPRSVTVNENITTQVDFDVVCSATAGQIEVTVTTMGEDLDDSYFVVVDDGASTQQVDANDTALFGGIAPGEHEVELDGMISNCSVDGDNPETVDVDAGQTSDVSFAVTCTRTTGDIRVTTTTTGPDPDPTGYEVTVSGVGTRSIGNTDEELFTDLQPDGYTVELTEVAVNCSVSGGPVQNATVTADDEEIVAYEISCVPRVGDLRVNVMTTGDDEDPDGYDARLDGNQSTEMPVDVDGSVTFSEVSTGSHSVTLVDVADNCEIDGDDSKSTIVEFDATVDLDFDVTCEQLTGSVQVNMTTGGDDPATEYTATLSGGQGSQSVPANGQMTFTDVPTGNYTVTISDIAANCTDDDGDDQEAVTVMEDMTANANFDYTCTSTTGSIFAEVTTSGVDPDTDGYTFTLDGGMPRSVGPNESTTYSGLAPDDYDVGIDVSTVADNCGVNETNPHAENVTAANTSNVSFTVTCDEITGAVAVNMTTGGDEPDTEYTATLSGGHGSLTVPATGTETFTDVPVGDYTVTISDIASNCTDDGGDDQEAVTVMEDATANATFSYTCTSTTGSIMVTTTTTGTPDPDGYFVALDGGTLMFIDDANSVPFNDLSPTSYEVLLTGLDGTCVVVEPPSNPATPTVIAGETVPVDFNVDCA